MQEAIFSKSVKAGAKTYFFDVKQAQNGKQSKYLQITESGLMDGKPVKKRLTIFADHLLNFTQALQEVSEKVR
jgi:hypothetical protein